MRLLPYLGSSNQMSHAYDRSAVKGSRENDYAEFIELPAPDRLRDRQLVPSLAGSCFLAPLDEVGP
jgi:hypothetical protein